MNTTGNDRTALVLGATGGIGGEVASQLRSAGWRVRALVRDRARVAARGDGLDWIEGDAMNAAEVLRAAQGASVIVHAVNPPGYRRWAELVLPMIDNSIAAARATGARLLLPGTVYNYGPDAFLRPDGALIDEDAPQHPLTRKGAIRVELESRLQRAAATGVRSLVVRAGDFFGPHAGNNWFAQGLVRPGRPPRKITQPGRAGVGHQWAYLPDVARTMVQLLEHDATLAPFARFHLRGHWDATGTQMVETIQQVLTDAGQARPRVAHFPWWLMRLASPVVTICRELAEMRYLWREPVRMGNDHLIAVLGTEPHTPWDEAVRATLAGQGGLPAAPEITASPSSTRC